MNLPALPLAEVPEVDPPQRTSELELSPELLRRLELLNVVARKTLSGLVRANRQSNRKGVSAEFVDHRAYVPGDDIRHVDWHLFGRLEELFLKLYREEENLHLTLLLDCSASMATGTGERTRATGPSKLVQGALIAAALAYIGLSNMDCVNLVPFNDRLLPGRWRLRGRGQVHGLFDFLRGLEGGGETALEQATRAFVAREPRRGVVVVISDFYDREGFQQSLKQLSYRKHDVHAIQVVDPTEASPSLRGDLRLVDSESGLERAVVVTDALKARYEEAFAALLEGTERFCARNEIGYAQAPTTLAFDALVLTILRRRGPVR